MIIIFSLQEKIFSKSNFHIINMIDRSQCIWYHSFVSRKDFYQYKRFCWNGLAKIFNGHSLTGLQLYEFFVPFGTNAKSLSPPLIFFGQNIKLINKTCTEQRLMWQMWTLPMFSPICYLSHGVIEQVYKMCSYIKISSEFNHCEKSIEHSMNYKCLNICNIGIKC